MEEQKGVPSFFIYSSITTYTVHRQSLLLIFFMILLSSGFSQAPSYYSFNDEKGFDPEIVYDLFEDFNGNIWIGTNQGLSKYDGAGFIQYKHAAYSTSISGIQQDSEGRIWCQNFSGQVFYISGEELKLFKDHKETFSSKLDYNVAFFPNIFISTEYGLFEIDFYSGETRRNSIFPRDLIIYQKIVNNDTLNYDPVVILGSKDSSLYLFNHEDLLIWNSYRGKVQKQILLKEYIFGWNRKPYIGSDEFGLQIWNGEDHKMIFFGKEDQGIVVRDLDSKFEVTYMLNRESQNHKLIGYRDGLDVINGSSGISDPVFMFHNYYISDILEDREGNIWIGSTTNGIHIIPNLEILQRKMDSRVRYFVEVPNQGLIMCSENGDVYRKNQKFEKLGSFKGEVRHPYYIESKNALGVSNTVQAFDLESRRPTKNPFGMDAKSVNFISPNTAIFSQSGGVSIRSTEPSKPDFSFLSDSIKSWSLLKEQLFQIRIRNVRSNKNLYDEERERLFSCFSDGLFLFEDHQEKEITYLDQSILAKDILLAEDDVLWIITVDGKILTYHAGSIRFYSDLEANPVSLDIWKEYLFCATSEGIIKINTADKSVEKIDITDGLQSNQILSMAVYDDTVYTATTGGLSYFAASYDQINQTPPLVEIQTLTVNSSDVKLTREHKFSHNENNFVIYFRAKSQRSRGQFSYKYKMHGIDSSWTIQPSEINFARYPSLPSGTYTFELIAVNEDGIESTPQEISFVLSPPFYQTWWFYLFLVSGVALVVSALFLIRIRIIRNKNALLAEKKEAEKQLSVSQLTTLRSQMNPHFVFNALNSIQDYIINNRKEQAGDYLGLFADLMRKYLSQSQQETVRLEEEIETLEMYLELERLRFEETLKTDVQMDESIDTSSIDIPTMLIQPFVENAIKHGLLHKKGNRELNISFSKESDKMRITISDNGIGREASAVIRESQNKPHRSFATSAIKKRVELLNSTTPFDINIEFKDLFPSGTEVTIELRTVVTAIEKGTSES